MKNLNIPFEDREYNELKKIKDRDKEYNWHDFIIFIANYYKDNYK